MIHALIPSIVSDQLAPTHNFLRLAPVALETRACSSPLPNDTQETSKMVRPERSDSRTQCRKHWFVFEVLVQRLEGFRTKYIWKCGSFGKGSTWREDMDKLIVLCTHLQSPAA